MEVLNEYITSVPITNLWHLWAGFVAMLAITVWLFVKESAIGIITAIVTLVFGGLSLVYTFEKTPYLERQGYITDPAAFVEMLNDWELVDQQGTLFTIREREPMTKDEIKEWKKHD